MGLFSSKKKTTYYSNHISIVKMDKQFKPYINSIVMSISLQGDRYTSATDIIKDGIANSPKNGLMRMFKYQAKKLGRSGELYAPTGDIYNLNYKQIIGIPASKQFELIEVEESFLEPDYYVVRWIASNRPELLQFSNDFEIEYSSKTKIISLTVGTEKISIPIPNVDPNTKTLYVLYRAYDSNSNKEYPVRDIKFSDILPIFEFKDKTYSLESSKTINTPITLSKEVVVVDLGTNEEISKKVTYREELFSTKENVYMNRDISQADYAKGVVGYEKIMREKVVYRDAENVRTYTGYVNVRGRLRKTLLMEKVIEQVPVRVIELQTSHIKMTKEAPKETNAFIYQLGSGNKQLDSLLTSRASLGFKANPLIVKRNEVLVSPSNYTSEYNFNNETMRKFSNSTSNYSDIYQGFVNTGGLSDIKEGILMFGVDIGSDAQFAYEYGYMFFSHILNYFGINEGTYYANNICKQNAGNLYYDAGVGNVTRKKYSGVYDAKYKIGRVYVKRNVRAGSSGGLFSRPSSANIQYIIRTSPVTYETITVDLHGQSATSSVHWISHGISGASGDNQDAGARIPLLEGVLKRMPVKYVADIAKYSPSVLLTTYETVKIRWYQRSIFKVVVAVIMITISILFPPAGGAAAAVAGTIGATVATYMALSGIAYLVVAYAVNAVIGMVVAKIVTATVGKFIGGQLGQLVSTIVTTVAMQSFQSGQSLGSSFSSMFKDMFSMSRLLDLSNLNKAIGYGANKYLQKKVENLKEIQKRIDDMKEQLKDVKEKTEELYAKSGIMDTRYLLDAISDDLPSDIMATAEMPDTFINRATLKGSEIADMTLSTIYDFVEIELSSKNFVPSYE